MGHNQARRVDPDDDDSPTLSDEERSAEAQYVLDHQDLLVMYSVNRNESFAQTRRWLRMHLNSISSNLQASEWPEVPQLPTQYDSSKGLQQGSVFKAVRVHVDTDADLREQGNSDEMEDLKQEPEPSASKSDSIPRSKGKTRRVVQDSDDEDEDEDEEATDGQKSPKPQKQTPVRRSKGKSRASSGTGTPRLASTSNPARTGPKSAGSGSSGKRRR